MATTDIERFNSLKTRRDELITRKVRLEEQKKAAEKSAKDLVAEITAKGYDYKKLPETLREKQAQITSALSAFQEGLDAADQALRAIEARQ